VNPPFLFRVLARTAFSIYTFPNDPYWFHATGIVVVGFPAVRA